MDLDFKLENCIQQIKETLNSSNKQFIVEEIISYYRKKDTSNDKKSTFFFGHSVSQINSILDGVSKSYNEKTLGEYLRDLVDTKNIRKDSDIYNKACIRRDYWYKLIYGKIKNPSKIYLYAIAISLELTLPEVIELLERAGYTFMPSDDFDTAIIHILKNNIYNPDDVDYILVDKLNLPSLFTLA